MAQVGAYGTWQRRAVGWEGRGEREGEAKPQASSSALRPSSLLSACSARGLSEMQDLRLPDLQGQNLRFNTTPGECCATPRLKAPVYGASCFWLL